MAGAVGIVFGLCVLSFTLGAALMYVLVRRREDAGARSPSALDEPAERTWVEKPPVVEAIDDEYDSRPIHRNPVVGLPQLEPALAAFAEPVADDEPETVGAAGYDRDGDLEPPSGDDEAPESTVAADTDSPEVVEESLAHPDPVADLEPLADLDPLADSDRVADPDLVADAGPLADPEAEPEPEPVAETAPEVVVDTALPPPAAPQPVEHTTWVEREDFRQRYLRTFEEVRRKAGSN
ncbi:hypothetical protein UK23_34160 [Lentzea aerocolonigenes]|uniref:Uncharacterized protein n=1 Tax=Lentzea aerocolonigenes TaxID=68170 RepID=A0A0F0GMU0_LENAE|nr:hypothetical protein [Lentzea aerocolonigenes]KJK43247.1 hypothetical protein UK23_34160 [Lentzea aerocolonigenes]